jgi:endonuclease/exonuclease/phosphatase family metal-dependent hydrolase
MSRLRRALAALAVLSCTACGSATSYLDPQGPLHTFPHALAPPAAESGSLRVVSFNIAYALEIDRAVAVLRETEALRAPDILALQEMDAPGTERIARALGLNAVYLPSGVHPKHDRDFGCAVLSPWPLVEPAKLLLPHAARGSGLRRSAAVATVVRGAQRIRVYSVHLPSPLAISGRSRLEELRVLGGDAAASKDPVVIAGDFNSHGKVAELERAGFAWLTRELGATTRFSLLGIPLARLRYDHVLARGFVLSGEPGAMGVVEDNRGASDHKPIWAVLLPSDKAR